MITNPMDMAVGQELTGNHVDEPASPAEPIIARDPAMIKLVRFIGHVASSDANVLITGESGAGKQLVAHYLHYYSARNSRPFVSLNCAAIPDALLETELFGNGEADFRGATSRRIGKFEAADGGTLLLDEIGEMDLRMQAKVLRAVRQREIDRAGDHPIPVDVRIVATTSKNVYKEVRLGRFRPDLFFRLNVIALRVPPLRERPADIPILAEFFLKKFVRASGSAIDTISPAALAVLRRHSWPGNVRELENVMHRAVLIETGPSIKESSLDIDAADEFDEAIDAPESYCGERPGAVHITGRTIDAVEKDMILDAVYQCKGNRTQAAMVLGISIRTLRNKLHEYERDGARIPRPVIVAVA